MSKSESTRGSKEDPIDLEEGSPTRKRFDADAKRLSESPARQVSIPTAKRHRGNSGGIDVAPIKIFRTRQMEQDGKLSDIVRNNTTCLRELLLQEGNAIQWIVLSNFLVDFGLLLEEVPELVSANLLLCFYGNHCDGNELNRWKQACSRDDGSSRFHAICLKPSDAPNSPNNPLPFKVPYGVHHSKFFLVGYSDSTLRVVVHTANLVYGDLHLKTDAAYVQDFPRKQNGADPSPFEEDLLKYMQSYRYTKSHSWPNDAAKPLTIVELLRQYDFSSAKGILISSTPGYHRGDDMNHFGHMKLRQAVRQSSNTRNRSAAVVCQFSSMGSLNEGWLKNEFGGSATGGIVNTTSPIKLVFPTAEEVRQSVEGYAGGSSLPSNSKNMEKNFLRPLYHKWSSAGNTQNPFSLNRNLPHIKTFFRFNEADDGMQYFVLTSHNMSSAAWGQLQKKGQQLFVRHWELGIFLSPETLACTHLVPLSLASSFPADTMAIPLPYKHHPVKYSDGDSPWAWDKVYQYCDNFGRRSLQG